MNTYYTCYSVNFQRNIAFVGLSDCQTIGPSDYRTVGLSDYRTVGLSDCRIIGRTPFWDHQEMNAILLIIGIVYGICRIAIKSVQDSPIVRQMLYFFES
jgi:hypothetical protein